MAVSAIMVEDLHKDFPRPRSIFTIHKKREDVHALQGVDMEVKKGEIFGLLGENGAGKTTLTKILSTLVLPTRGRALVDGHDVLKEPSDVRSKIGLVSCEERSFYWKLTGRQNLIFFGILQNLSFREAQKRADEVLELTGLYEAGDRRFEGYSSGMRQKMAIARGLLNDPEILFLDEPTRSLDINAARVVRDFIRDEAGMGRTVFLTTHNLHEAEELCNRVAIIDRGKIRAQGEVKDLRRVLRPGVLYEMELDNDISHILTHLDGEVDAYFRLNGHYHLSLRAGIGRLPDIVKRIVEGGGRITSMDSREPNLEEIFENYTKGEME